MASEMEQIRPFDDKKMHSVFESYQKMTPSEKKKLHGAGHEYDPLSKGRLLDDFKEAKEIERIIGNLKNVHDKQIPKEMSDEKFTFIMNEYQEQPHLLDPHLDALLLPLLELARDPESPASLSNAAFRYMYLVTKVRGYKTIVRHLPHEATDLEPVLTMLSHQKPDDFAAWETRYMLILWLSIVCMIPFDMARFDSNAASESGEVNQPIMNRILDVGKLYLSSSDKSMEASAYMTARFLTRHDVKMTKLSQVVDWILGELDNVGEKIYIETVNRLRGLMLLLHYILKFSKREDIIPYGAKILSTLTKLNLLESNHTVLKILAVKNFQNLGLTFLKPKVAAWRYQRGSRSLAENLGVKPSANIAPSMIHTELADDTDEDYDIPDEIEEVIEQLLNGLRDKDTIVRWSAAKGVGRVTGRLPEELADEVVGSVLELLSPREDDGAWHGGCLTLAELGRRGLLLPKRLEEVIPVVLKALVYDEKRGYFSVGADVRDSACYVCWAFARAYDPKEIKAHVNEIAGALLVVSVFDREVNVRRAASAAFQENVGRQGTFPHGIDIVTTCDYYAVGNRPNCYLEISSFVAQYEEYTRQLIDHLVEKKTGHWDLAIRELASQALNKLTCKAPEYLAKEVLPALLKQSESSDLNVRHGAILALAEVTYALAQVAWQKGQLIENMLDDSIIQGMKGIAGRLQEAKLLLGLGGELTRKAVCCLIDRLSQARMPFHQDDIIDVWQAVIDDCLHHVEPTVQEAASRAIPAFFTEYYRLGDGTANPEIQERIIEKYLTALRGNIETSRMGYCLALGSLPRFMIHGKLRPVMNGLLRSCMISQHDKCWAEARREAVKAVSRVCSTVGVVATGSPAEVVCEENIGEIYESLLIALRDYTLDTRGDVGSWVREAAMTAIHEITTLVVVTDASLVKPEMTKNVFCSLAQQSCEKIDRTRSHACEIFFKMLHQTPAIPHIPEVAHLREIFEESGAQYFWCFPSASFPRFARLLAFEDYRYSVLLGFTVSVGGLTESLVKYSSESLFGYLTDISEDLKSMETFTSTLLRIFRDHSKVDRVTVPMLKVLDQLLANNILDVFTQDSSCSFPMDVLSCCKTEITKCGDPQKLMASGDVFCGLLQFTGEVRRKCLTQLLIFLAHRYPRVRKTTANKLYESLVTYDGVIDFSLTDQVFTILSETDWDEELSEVRLKRNELCNLLQLPVPKIVKPKEPSK